MTQGRKTFLVSCQYHMLVARIANEFDIAQALGFPLCILHMYTLYVYFIDDLNAINDNGKFEKNIKKMN